MKLPFPALVAIAVSLGVATAGCNRAADPATADTRLSEAAGVAAAAAASGNSMALTNAYIVLPAVPGRPGAAYFTIANPTDRTAILTGVTIAGAREAEMHQTSGGTMQALASVEVPAGGSVAFAPGGRHVMIFGLPAALHAGETSKLTASFKDGEKLTTALAVRAPGTAAGEAMAGMKMN